MGKVKWICEEFFPNEDKYQFPMGKVEVLSKSASDWLTVPMQQRSKSGFIRDWLSATAKGDKYRCTFQNRTSIPNGKGKGKRSARYRAYVLMYQFPMGKVKYAVGQVDVVRLCVSIPYGKGKGQNWGGCVLFPVYLYQFPMGKVKSALNLDRIDAIVYQFPMGKVKFIHSAMKRYGYVMYQFPMGKVKRRFFTLISLSCRINSLWER